MMKRKTKKKKKKTKSHDSDVPTNEYELQKKYHKWDMYKHPFTLTHGCSYGHMNPGAATIAKNKGYLTGIHDYLRLDPRFMIEKDKDSITLQVIPFQMFDFKHPNGKGKTSPEQKNVMINAQKRGAMSFITNDFKQCTKKIGGFVKITEPLYAGTFVITGDNLKISVPPPPKIRIKMPPRRGFNEEDRKKRERKRKEKLKSSKKKKPRKRKKTLKSTSKVKSGSKSRLLKKEQSLKQKRKQRK